MQTLRFLVAALLPCALGACTTATMQGQVSSRAQRDYQCPEQSVKVRQIRRNTFKVNACDKRLVYQCHAYTERCEDLTKLAERRARAELSCGPSIVVREVSPYSFMIKGCSQAMTYHCEMTGGVGRCAPEGDRR